MVIFCIEKGEIIFYYLSIPATDLSSLLTDDDHGLDATEHGRVLSGISDAYPVGDVELHQYHSVTVNVTSLANLTRVNFTPKKSCNMATSCDECVR